MRQHEEKRKGLVEYTLGYLRLFSFERYENYNSPVNLHVVLCQTHIFHPIILNLGQKKGDQSYMKILCLCIFKVLYYVTCLLVYVSTQH